MLKDYDCECIFYLGIEIMKLLELEDKCLYIDEYYIQIKNIYEDYKNYDDNDKSLLDSIDSYINNKYDEIEKRIEVAINE